MHPEYTQTVPIYAGWMVEFHIDNVDTVHIRRYKRREGRPQSASEYIPKKAMLSLAVELLRKDLGELTTEELRKKHALH